MLNPLNPIHRERLPRAVEQSYQELKRYGRMRDNTIRAYLGASPHLADWDWMGRNDKYKKSLPKGNLLQLAGLRTQIAMAFGEPQFLCTARVPEHTGLAEKLTAALNRMAALLDLGETARSVAADSFFGYGIYKCGVGRMPLSAQVATGLEIGPCVWRVSQDDLIYDITSANWNSVKYVGDLYTRPLDEAQEDYPLHADRLAAMTDIDRLDSPHVMPRPSRFHAPELEVWLLDLYFPAARVVATWPVRNESFGELANEPLEVREYEGHWSGVYQVLNHLYAPDELVPIAQAESVKSLHFLFNDVLGLTSEQARRGKVNPIYQAGSDRDMIRLWQAEDRRPVSVNDPSRFGLFEIPGPTQSQTAFLAATLNLFKEFVPSIDEPARAPTARQGELERDTTNATVGEARRKFNRALQQVGYKLGHLLMNNNDIILPASKPLRPGSRVPVDVSWQPAFMEPRVGKIDDFDINIEPFSTIYRTPDERLQRLITLSNQIILAMQAQAAGAPINVEAVIDTVAEYSGEPRLRDWYEEVDPLHQAKRQSSRMSAPRIGVGQYTRHNVSEKTTAGALEQNLNEVGTANGTAGRFE